MVICLIALVVFGVMGIFSAKYKKLAKDSFHCFFRMVQLKPCDTSFDQQIKATVTAKFMKWPSVAGIIYRNFNLISWIFVIIFFASLAGLGYGIYNYVLFGNCNGPGSTSFCVINSASGWYSAFLKICQNL
jgi:hypothetical protein